MAAFELCETNMSLTLAARTRQMNASAIREILKLTERPGVLSLGFKVSLSKLASRSKCVTRRAAGSALAREASVTGTAALKA